MAYENLVIPVVVGVFDTVKKGMVEDGGKHKESIRSSYCDRDSKDLHSRNCANPQEGA